MAYGLKASSCDPLIDRCMYSSYYNLIYMKVTNPLIACVSAARVKTLTKNHLKRWLLVHLKRWLLVSVRLLVTDGKMCYPLFFNLKDPKTPGNYKKNLCCVETLSLPLPTVYIQQKHHVCGWSGSSAPRKHGK